MSGTPEWLDDKGKIIEHKYCRSFLEKQPMLSKGEDFFTTEGIVTDKDRLLRDVFDDIKEHLTGGLVTKAKNLLEAIRMEWTWSARRSRAFREICMSDSWPFPTAIWKSE